MTARYGARASTKTSHHCALAALSSERKCTYGRGTHAGNRLRHLAA